MQIAFRSVVPYVPPMSAEVQRPRPMAASFRCQAGAMSQDRTFSDIPPRGLRLPARRWALQRAADASNPSAVVGRPNVYRLICGEAPRASGVSGAPLAGTNDSVGGRDLQAA